MKPFHARILAGLILIAALAGCAARAGPQESWFDTVDRLAAMSAAD